MQSHLELLKATVVCKGRCTHKPLMGQDEGTVGPNSKAQGTFKDYIHSYHYLDFITE